MSVRSPAPRGLRCRGLAAAPRCVLTRRGAFVLTFHGVAERRYDDLPAKVQPAFHSASLRAALRWIGRRFAFLTPRELLHGQRPGVLLTFDDGFANNYANALPILEQFAAPAVFFVSTQHVQEPHAWLPATRAQARHHWPNASQVPEPIARDLFDGMSREQLRSCAEHPLVSIGAHTVHHPFLTRCDDTALAEELERSRSQLRDWSGQDVDLVAYPAGDYDERVARAVRDAGYRAAFAEDPVGVGLPDYEIPRVGLYFSDPPYLAAKLSGLHRKALSLKRLPAA